MKQAIVRSGQVAVDDIPAPAGGGNMVVIRVAYSCVSAGTEMQTIRDSGKSKVKKVLESPEKLVRAVASARSMGWKAYLENLKGMTMVGSTIGYSVSGFVLDVGDGESGLKVGDRVAAAGADHAFHAEIVGVPSSLVVRVPDEVSLKDACTLTPGAIALHGARRCELSLGDLVVVFGTGLLGMLATQLLAAMGARVICVDLNQERLDLTRSLGAEAALNAMTEDPVEAVMQMTGGTGVDAVLFAADASSKEPLSQAFRMCRKKGRVVMLGKANLSVDRADVYRKELDLLTSTSYGPGRYDPQYELHGHDYPFGYVRWTEHRNMEEYLRLLANSKVVLKDMIREVTPIERAGETFDNLKTPGAEVMSILSYEQEGDHFLPESRTVSLSRPDGKNGLPRLAVIGPGGFARAVHLPILQQLKDRCVIHTICGRSGHKAKAIADQYGAQKATTDFQQVIEDDDVDVVVILTSHGLHADMALRALEKGKAVFVEKPLCTTMEDFVRFESLVSASQGIPLLFVGYNRRFSPIMTAVKRETDQRRNPLTMLFRMNAGRKPSDDTQFSEGGRIVGEACHYIDLMTSLTDCRITRVSTSFLRPETEWFRADDNALISVEYEDGSMGTVMYGATGHPDLAKEYLEIHWDGKSVVVDDFVEAKGFGTGLSATLPSGKGHRQEWEAFLDAFSGQEAAFPIPLWDLLQTSKYSLQAADALHSVSS